MPDIDPATDQPPPEGHALLALDMLSLAILVVDTEGRIKLANRAAEKLLLSMEAAEVPGNSRQPPDFRRSDHRLPAALARSISGDEPYVLMQRARTRPLTILTVPAVGEDHAVARPVRIVFIGDPGAPAARDLGAEARLYGLTRSETRLLEALLSGKRVSEYAAQAGITLNTAKGYLKQLFRKTQTARQSDLVRLILADPVLRLVSSMAGR